MEIKNKYHTVKMGIILMVQNVREKITWLTPQLSQINRNLALPEFSA